MNPILKKLSDQALTDVEIAELLQRHIGDGRNPYHCEEAIFALKRLRDERALRFAEAVATFQGFEADPCTTIESVIAMLRQSEDGKP